MVFDFKVQKDDYGYYIVGYRLTNGVMSLYDTNSLISTAFNFLKNDYVEYLKDVYQCDEKPINDRMHFKNYEMAVECMNGLRDIVPRAIETGNLFLP